MTHREARILDAVVELLNNYDVDLSEGIGFCLALAAANGARAGISLEDLSEALAAEYTQSAVTAEEERRAAMV